MDFPVLKNIIEAVLLTVDSPISLRDLQHIFEQENTSPSKEEIAAAIEILQQEYQGRSMEVQQVASGYRIQVKQEYALWIHKLSQERSPRYSRAFLEILAIIAYRQPITRGEIEAIRGVAVNTQIIKTLMEREWIYIIGYKPVPGKPAVYGTTKRFLDDLNLQNLEQLPELIDMDKLARLVPLEDTL